MAAAESARVTESGIGCNRRNYFVNVDSREHRVELRSLSSFRKVLSFEQDNWRHTRKVTALFDWAGNSNLVGSLGLDNQLLLYDIRLARPVLSRFVKAPFQNCVKTCDDKLALAPRDSECRLEVFDMRKFDQAYASLVDKCLARESCQHIVRAMAPKFDCEEAPFNLRFPEKFSLASKFNLSKRESKFVSVLVGARPT